ncbi:MAG: hypothetical protein J5I92_05480 [Thiogranum sp.]|nr:hypothetical protein [Thiogranum sp.]
MKGIVQSLSALVLGFSSVAFTAPAQADSGLTVIYSHYDHKHRAYPGQPFYYTHKHVHKYAHKPARYGRVWAVAPRHYHPRHEYGYGHRKHDPWNKGHDKHTRRDHDRRFEKRHDSYRKQSGYAAVNRY